MDWVRARFEWTTQNAWRALTKRLVSDIDQSCTYGGADPRDLFHISTNGMEFEVYLRELIESGPALKVTLTADELLVDAMVSRKNSEVRKFRLKPILTFAGEQGFQFDGRELALSEAAGLILRPLLPD